MFTFGFTIPDFGVISTDSYWTKRSSSNRIDQLIGAKDGSNFTNFKLDRIILLNFSRRQSFDRKEWFKVFFLRVCVCWDQCDQCDQVGLFLKDLDDKFSYTNGPIIW